MLASFDIGQHTANARNLSRRQYPKEFLASVLNKYTVDLMEYFHLTDNPNYRALWRKSYRNKLGLLTKGMPVRVKGTCTILFIDKADIPADLWKDVTYGCIVISYRPKKAYPNCTRLIVGGNRVNYPGYCGTPTTDLLTAKLFLNITIFTPGARFITLNIKYIYLMNPMERYKHMQLKLSDLPKYVVYSVAANNEACAIGVCLF